MGRIMEEVESQLSGNIWPTSRTDGWANDCSVSIIVKEEEKKLFILIASTAAKRLQTSAIIVGCEEQTRAMIWRSNFRNRTAF